MSGSERSCLTRLVRIPILGKQVGPSLETAIKQLSRMPTSEQEKVQAKSIRNHLCQFFDFLFSPRYRVYGPDHTDTLKNKTEDLEKRVSLIEEELSFRSFEPECRNRNKGES